MVAGAIPTFNQFTNVPPPSSIANLPGFESVFEPRVSQQQQQTPLQQTQNVAYNASNTALSYSNVGPSQPYSSAVNTSDDNNVAFYSQPSLQTYSTYPQVQHQVTTPITLQGMPPITVSTTIPTQQFPGFLNQPTSQ